MAAGALVAVGAVDFESAVLAAASRPPCSVVRRCVDVADLVASAATGRASVALVSTALSGLDTDVVARVRQEHVTVLGVVPVEPSLDADHLRRLGVDSVLPVGRLGDLPGLATRVTSTPAAVDGLADRTLSTGRAGGRQAADGVVLAVWGASGAPGRSVVAQGLAAATARRGLSTLLVDADVYGGAQAQLLGLLDESSGLLAAARAANRGRLDTAELAATARALSPTLRLLSGLPRSDRWVELAPVLLRRILEVARGLCRLTVVDCGFSIELDEELSYDVAAPRRNGATLTALEQADRVVVVGAADPVGLGRLLRALDDVRGNVPETPVRVVVNRMRPTLGWSADQVSAVVRRTASVEVEAFLPDDPAACDRALVRGQTLAECAPNAKLTRALGRLADQLVEELLPTPAPGLHRSA